MRDQDGYMSRDAWSSESSVLPLQHSCTGRSPTLLFAQRIGIPDYSSDFSPLCLIRTNIDPTMPIDLSEPETSRSTQEILPFANQQQILQEAFEALSIDPNSQESSTDELKSHLLSLPAELRTAIYATTLFENPNDLDILYTNRQVYMEASPILYQRPINFPSQAKLMASITRSGQTDLNRVRTLTLRLTDVDFAPLFENSPASRSRPSAWSLYQQELEKLDKALQSLPNLIDLSIVPPERSNSQLLKGMYLSFLGLIPERLPRLRRLTIHDYETLLEKVPNLRKLANVVFNEPKSASSSPSSSASREIRSFQDVMKHTQSPSPTKAKVKAEEIDAMEGVWFGRR